MTIYTNPLDMFERAEFGLDDADKNDKPSISFGKMREGGF